MPKNVATSDDRGLGHMRDFIFSRELAEVYLLLDHVSGRPDKKLDTALIDADKKSDKAWIEEICEIGWPPPKQAVQKAAQAAILLRAKDRLNGLAYPASGATIAFTLLVAGEDNEGRDRPHKASGSPTIRQKLGARFGFSSRAKAPPAAEKSRHGVNPNDLGKDGKKADGDWDRHPPTRMSLARIAYPGLAGTARRFRRNIGALIILLVIWLFCTCVLSWNITVGHAILARIDAVRAQRADIVKKITDIENEDARAGAQPPGSPQSVAGGGKRSQRYCDGVGRLSPENGIPQFRSAAEHQVCDLWFANTQRYEVAREDLGDWLAGWGWLKWVAHKYCGADPCWSDKTTSPPESAAAVGAIVPNVNEQWASILIEVLAGAVLPLCYGFLGAGAAVVRSLWGRMRDSLLSPRDWTLALGQLALGAVIGACIGLFVAPSGANTAAPGGVGLTGSVALSASALSFIAGFGVEGVFVAMESLIKRVFNIGEPGSARSSQVS